MSGSPLRPLIPAHQALEPVQPVVELVTDPRRLSGLPCYVPAVQRPPDAPPEPMEPVEPVTLPPPPERLQAALKAIRWTYGTLAVELRTSPSTTRNWGLGRSPVPPAILRWVELLAEFHRQVPAPPQKDRET